MSSNADKEQGWQILELGCGKNKRYPHSIGVDILESVGPDIRHDLNVFPYPFADNTFDLVLCEHVLEHVNDLVRTMEEIHRVLKPDGLLRVETPHFTSVSAHTDPTHKRFFTASTLDYFSPHSSFIQLDYSAARFEILSKKVELQNRWKPRLLTWWINRCLYAYERQWAYFLPSEAIRFELRALK